MIKALYRRYFYLFFKQLERTIRTSLFLLLRVCIPKFNSYRLFGLPAGWTNVESATVVPAQNIVRQAPKSVETHSHPYFEALEVMSTEGKVALLQGGIQTASAATFTHRGYLVREFTEQLTMEAEYRHKFFTFRKSRCLAHIPHFEATVASLVVDCQNNYYHWLFDVLPKLHLLDKAGHSIDRYYVDTSRSFQRDSLRLLGVDRTIATEKFPQISASTLVSTTFPCLGGVPRWVVDYLRAQFLPKTPHKPTRRLFISRRDAPMRHIINEEEFLPYLEKEGFQTVVASELSFQEQVALFSEAQIIIAPHGAGLSNLVFAPKSAKVIEIYSPRSTCICFWSLANVLNLDYRYFRGIDDPSTYARTEPAHDHILVDPKKLQRSLENALD